MKSKRNGWIFLRLNGWGRGIRTPEWRSQNPLPYHLAIPQGGISFLRKARAFYGIRRGCQIRFKGSCIVPVSSGIFPFLPTWQKCLRPFRKDRVTPLFRGVFHNLAEASGKMPANFARAVPDHNPDAIFRGYR